MKGKVRDGQVRGDRLLGVGLLGARLMLEDGRGRRRRRFHGHDVIVLVLGPVGVRLPVVAVLLGRMQVVPLLLLVTMEIVVEVAAIHSGGGCETLTCTHTCSRRAHEPALSTPHNDNTPPSRYTYGGACHCVSLRSPDANRD